jgi:RNase P subunit RPR2
MCFAMSGERTRCHTRGLRATIEWLELHPPSYLTAVYAAYLQNDATGTAIEAHLHASIWMPGTLLVEAASRVCQQCHIQGRQCREDSDDGDLIIRTGEDCGWSMRVQTTRGKPE